MSINSPPRPSNLLVSKGAARLRPVARSIARALTHLPPSRSQLREDRFFFFSFVSFFSPPPTRRYDRGPVTAGLRGDSDSAGTSAAARSLQLFAHGARAAEQHRASAGAAGPLDALLPWLPGAAVTRDGSLRSCCPALSLCYSHRPDRPSLTPELQRSGAVGVRQDGVAERSGNDGDGNSAQADAAAVLHRR